MQTIIVLISKISNDGIIYWIESNRKISSKLIDELNNDPDTILLVNPINEWQEFKFEKLTVQISLHLNHITSTLINF
jgi:hypothetical protein